MSSLKPGSREVEKNFVFLSLIKHYEVDVFIQRSLHFVPHSFWNKYVGSFIVEMLTQQMKQKPQNNNYYFSLSLSPKFIRYTSPGRILKNHSL